MRLYTNNAVGQLASGITNVATSLTLQTSQGAQFPNPTSPDHFLVTLIDSSNQLEIVKCTARTGDTLTIVRAQEGTTNRAYSAGDRVELRQTAGGFNQTPTVGLVKNVAVGGGTANAMTATFADSSDAALQNGMTFFIQSVGENTSGAPTLNVTLGSTATGAKTIVKGSNEALVDGDIPGTDYACEFQYDSSLDKYVLKNPHRHARIDVEAKSALFTVVAKDHGKTFLATGTWTATISAAGTLGAGFWCKFRNEGSGVITLSSGEVINGGEEVVVLSDGTTISEFRSSGGFTRIEVITATDAGWTVPSNVYRIKATVVGGGGNGGGVTANSGYALGGGGGGGGGTSIAIVATTPGTVIAVTVGGAGGTSSFGAHASATGGGTGGTASSSATGAAAAGGVGSSGDLNLNGQGGSSGMQSNNTGETAHSGSGGASYLGAGARARAANGNGFSGGSYGGGGSGGANDFNLTNRGGGGGGSGVVILEY